MKKAIFMTVILFWVGTIIFAFADNTKTSGEYTYELKKNGTAVITKYNWDNSIWNKWGKTMDFFVPAMLDGYPVVEIADNAFALPRIDVNGVKFNIVLPDSLHTIGDFSFFQVPIESINIGENIEHIGYGAFASLSDYVRNEIRFLINPNQPYFAVIDGLLYSKQNKELIYAPCKIEHKIIIPEGIVSIGDYSFACCDIQYWGFIEGYKQYVGEYGEVVLPQSLKKIGKYAFYHCDGLYFFTIPQNVESIGEHSFDLEDARSGREGSITFKGTLITSIPDYAFYGTRVIGETNSSYNKNYKEIEISNPQDITHIGQYAGCGQLFYSANCFSPQITTIPSGLYPITRELPDTITTIESDAFEKVSDFKLSSFLSNIAEDAFPRGSTFIVESGTYAERWASENGFAYTVEGQQDNLDWLNN